MPNENCHACKAIGQKVWVVPATKYYKCPHACNTLLAFADTTGLFALKIIFSLLCIS